MLPGNQRRHLQSYRYSGSPNGCRNFILSARRGEGTGEMPTEPGTPQNVTNPQPTQPQAGATPATWDEWLTVQPEDVKALYTAHTAGLQNTVKATRQERDDFAKQAKDLLAKVEKGSEAEKALTETITKLEAAEKRAAFLEEATRPEIGCRNPKAAYALAMADQLFDRRGSPIWAEIKAAAPELFGAPSAPPANAGTGTGAPPAAGKNMNDFILAASGRRR